MVQEHGSGTTFKAQRWRYEDQRGRAIWLPFNPDFLCIYCDQPTSSLSMGGPAVCPVCDCGLNRDGSKLTMTEFQRLVTKARRRLNEMPDDPAWKEYEASWKSTRDRAPSPNV